MASPGSAASAEAAAGVTRGALVAELAELLGAPHEARFVVDEAVGLGLFLGQPDVPIGPLGPAVIAAARAMASAARRRRAVAVRLGPLVVPFARSAGRSPGAHSATRDRAGGRGGAGRSPAPDRRPGPGDRRRRHRVRAPIALSMAEELGVEGASSVWAVDASADALEVAAANLETVRVRTVPPGHASRCSRVIGCAALPTELRGGVDLVVANPPYVSEEEWPPLDPVVRSEPRSALVAGSASDGTAGIGRRGGTLVAIPGLAGPARYCRLGAGAASGRRRQCVGLSNRVRGRTDRAGSGSRAPGSGRSDGELGEEGMSDARTPSTSEGVDEVGNRPWWAVVPRRSATHWPAVPSWRCRPSVDIAWPSKLDAPGAEARLKALAADPDGPHYAVGQRSDVRA